MRINVLIIEDEVVLARNMERYLTRRGFGVQVANSGAVGIARARTSEPDIILLDYQLSDMVGLDALEPIRQSCPGAKIIMLTGNGSVEIAVAAMKAGADDYLSKPMAMTALTLALEKAVDKGRLETQLDYYQSRAKTDGLDALIGDSEPMQLLKQQIAQITAADATLADGDSPAVLITGETGTGKELVASALHRCGPRRNKPFIEINCASIPAHLIEAELFGYERGAFTDAKTSKPGLVEAADGGTLFLDEIGEVEPALQAKLLKLLEDKTVRRLGSIRERTVDTRIVAATNRNLEDMVAKGEFRSDLFFRLGVIRLSVAPLRARGSDVTILAEHFLNHHKQRYRKPGLHFTAEARAALLRHDWPGNVRQLRNAIEQVVLLAGCDAIGAEQLPMPSPVAARHEHTPIVATPSLQAGNPRLNDVEKQLIENALNKTGWNISRAAELLGLSRDTLRYRIPKHGLSRGQVT